MSQLIHLNILFRTFMAIPQKNRFLYYRQEKPNFLVMHNFTKCFSGTREKQAVNKCSMVNCLVFAVCYFWLCKKMMLTKPLLAIVDKIVFKVMTLPNNLVLICRFEDHILCFVHSARFVKYAFSAKI